jgi:hypothetical protein
MLARKPSTMPGRYRMRAGLRLQLTQLSRGELARPATRSHQSQGRRPPAASGRPSSLAPDPATSGLPDVGAAGPQLSGPGRKDDR